MERRLAVMAVFVVLSASWATAQVPAGGEFRVNTYTTQSQYQPAVTADAAGDFVVAWSSYGQDGKDLGVFGQRYDASGQPRGAEFQVNTEGRFAQSSPSVAANPAGGFIVAWDGYLQDGIGYGIFGRRFDATGAPLGPEFQVNTFTTHWLRHSEVACDAAGSFVVIWASVYQDGSDWGVFGQRYDTSGARRGAEFQVNTYTLGDQFGWWGLAVAAAPGGDFVVAWPSLDQDGSSWGIFAQRYDASGARRGLEFQVNTYTYSAQVSPSVASDAGGRLVVAWASYHQDGSGFDIFARRYDVSGLPQGPEFQVNTYTPWWQWYPIVASDAAGNFVVAWESMFQDGSDWGVFAQRYDSSGAPRGSEFPVNTYTTDRQKQPAVASDPSGTFVVAWSGGGEYFSAQDGSGYGVFAQRFGGVAPATLAVDTASSSGSDGNGVLETGESVNVKPSWKNVNGATQTFDAAASGFSGPAAAGVDYLLQDASGIYGTLPNGTTAECSDCYQVQVAAAGTRPATHWDATLVERLTPDTLGQTKPWSLHVGESFTDVPKTSGYYRFVERLLHRGVTGGCSASAYCPTATSSRQQMSIFALVAKEGTSYLPPACGTTPMFADVPVTSPYCRWVEELSRRGVVSGCGGGRFCPTSAVTRGQMPIFVLKTLDPTLDPPACGATPMFADVPAASPYCRWVEELARRGVVSGCGGGNYCPNAAVNRAQMAVFISATFSLTLYAP
jgi:hypothetical protein